MVKINNETVYPELPLEFTLDGTEEFKKGIIKLDNLTRVPPFDDYSTVDITINSVDYKFILESDLPNRVANSITTHPITLLEEVVKLNDVYIADGAFSTTEGVQTTWKYQIETVIEREGLDYTLATSTASLLNVTANNQQYSGSLLNMLVIAFRAVDAIPTIEGTVIGHNLLNDKNNDVTDEVQDILDNDEVESRRYEANINDYASSVYAKVKNGSYEENEEIGSTWFPSKDNYVSVRSSDNKYDDNNAEIQFNNGIRRITEAKIKMQIIINEVSGFIFGSVGDLPTSTTSGYKYTCDTDDYYSAVADMTFDDGDTATWVYDEWLKNYSTTTALYKDIDVTDYVLSKEEWDKYKISTNEVELYAGIYQNNTFYYTEGRNLLENIGIEYDLGFGWAKDTAYEACLKAIEDTYTIDLSNSYNDLRVAKWRFKYIPARDYDTDIERHTSDRVKIKSVKTNQQQESRVEIGKYGKANYQYVNRLGNDRFEITVRYFATDPYSLGLKTYDDIFELFDYYKGYKIVKIKYLVYSNLIDCTYLFVANQSNLNPNSAFTNPVSPYTIQDKIEAKTCLVKKNYVVFGDDLTDNSNIAPLKNILWNRFDYNSAYDTPIYTAVYSSDDADEDIALDVQRAIEGRGFTLNVQFNSKTVAGSKIEVTPSTAGFGHKLTPINYVNEFGEVDECIIEYCNEVTVTPEDYPIADSYISKFGNYTRTVKLQPNEILGETQRIECIADRENLFIYRPYLLNNSLMKEIGEDCTLLAYYYTKPVFTTDTSSLPYTATSSAVTVGTYELTITPPSTGLSYAIADSVTGELYFAYNNYGTELTTITMSLRLENPNFKTLGSPVEWVETLPSAVVTGGACDVLDDIGNIKQEYLACEYETSGIPYFSTTDESTTIQDCTQGEEYTSCTYNSELDTWTCQDYVGTVDIVKYECQLK